MTIINNTIFHFSKLLREKILKVLITRKKCFYCDLLARFIVLIISQYIQILNVYAVQLKLIKCYICK